MLFALEVSASESHGGPAAHAITPAHANAAAHADSAASSSDTEALSAAVTAAATSVHALDASTGTPIENEKIFSSPKDSTKTYIDAKNNRVELGRGASAYFDESGALRLLRGSAILESSAAGKVRTVNAAVDLVGKAIFSYDHKEQSTSVFVVFGTATLVNTTNPDGKKTLARNEGATLVTGDFYPSAVRNLDFTVADAWLSRYGWKNDERAELLKGLPNGQAARTLASLEEQNPKRSQVTRELASYFPVAAPTEEGPKKYEGEFTSSVLRGKEETEVEYKLMKGEEIEIIAPEQAAVIVLPEIDLGPGLRLTTYREDAVKPSPRKPASLAKVKTFSPASHPAVVKRTDTAAAANDTGTDPAVASALDRLNQVESIQSGIQGDSEDKRWNDLRENF